MTASARRQKNLKKRHLGKKDKPVDYEKYVNAR